MNLSAPFIRRPIATTLIAVGITCVGFLAFYFLPVASLPEIDFPTINVQASLPGASPEVMATSIATPLEKQLGNIAGVTEMTSTSSLGSTRITLQFDLDRNINGAARDVQAAINAALSNLPKNLPGLPTYRKVNPADAPIIILALTSHQYDTGQLYDLASTRLAQKIFQMDGIGDVIVGGSALPAVRIQINPYALQHYGIGLDHVQSVIAAANNLGPQGQLHGTQITSDILTNTQMNTPEDYKSLIVSYKNLRPILIKDIARVVKGVENVHADGKANGKPSVFLIVFKQPGANVINTVNNLRKQVPLLRAIIPAGINMDIVLDRTLTIRASMDHVKITLILAIFLMTLVVYAFMKNYQAALVSSIIVPVSLLGTFGMMYLLGYTLNNLSLMALTIATGFVVDDVVVVLENISRHLEKGKTTFQAALDGAKEVSFTVVSISLSLITVFTPILFMGGIVGRLFREFAITLSIAILFSLVTSLTMVPMFCSKLLTPMREEDAPRWLKTLHKSYAKSLQWSLSYPKILLGLTGLAVILNVSMFITIPKGFFPIQDTGRISGSLQGQQNLSVTELKDKLTQFMKVVMADPAVAHAIGYIGGSNNSGNGGSFNLSLKPQDERKISATDVIKRLREPLSQITGASLILSVNQDLVIGGRQSKGAYQYTLTSYDLGSLQKVVPTIRKKLSKIPGIVDLNTDLLDKGMQNFIMIDREAAIRYNVSTLDIDKTLYNAFGQKQVSSIYADQNQYHVILVVDDEYWQDMRTLENLYVSSKNGTQIPLSALTHITTSDTLLGVNHQGLLPAVTFSFNLTNGVSLGQVINKIETEMKTLNLPKEKYQASFRGTAEAFQSSLASEPYLILGALLAIYLILGILYESLLHPITILSTLPSAGIGALLALQLFGFQFDILGLIGILLLIGIVKKNAIMMIDFALTLERTEGYSPEQAIHEAAVLRFRPIMMTTTAAIFAAIPLAIGMGVGGEMRQPLGVAIIGGLCLSQILTLYTTPIIYVTLEHLKQSVYNRFSTKPQSARIS